MCISAPHVEAMTHTASPRSATSAVSPGVQSLSERVDTFSCHGASPVRKSIPKHEAALPCLFHGQSVLKVAFSGLLFACWVFVLGTSSSMRGFCSDFALATVRSWFTVESLLAASVAILLASRSKAAAPGGILFQLASARALRTKQAKSTCPGVSGRIPASTVGRSDLGAQPALAQQAADLHCAVVAAQREGQLRKAEQLIQEFERRGAIPKPMTYNLLIRAHACRGDASAAEKWLKHTEGQHIRTTHSSYNVVLDACAKAGKVESCVMLLNRMLAMGVAPDLRSFTTTINAFAQRGDVAAAHAWLQKMIAAGVEPDAVIYNTLIHACGVKGLAEDAERWLEEMEFKGLETSLPTFTSIIHACAKAGEVDRAEAWFARMVDKGVEPNIIAFGTMIDTCAKAGNLVRAEHWHDQMVLRGITPDAVVFTSVINACSKVGDVERASRVLQRMRASGVKPRVEAYAALALPYAKRGNWHQVESISVDMTADGVAVNEYFAYAQLLSYACCRSKQVGRAENYFRRVLEAGVEANDHIVLALTRCVGRPRCVELMQELTGGWKVPVQPCCF